MEEINIREFFIYLKSYIAVFVIVIAMAIVGVVIYDDMIKKPMYQAQTTVVIAKSDNVDGSVATTLNDINASQKLVTTYSEIAKSELVLSQVVKNLKLDTTAKALSKNLTIKPVDDTSILSITARSLEPELASSIANEIAKVFAAEVENIYKVENVTQLSVAVTSDAPINKTTTRDLVLAVVVATFAVGGFAFLRFYLDDTVKYSDDLEKSVGLPMVGCITKGDVKVRRAGSELIAERLPKAIVSENIKSLRTNLQFTAIDKDLKTILVTSTNASEGKSFISTNLAISFAQADKRVLLIDCDLRKGRIHKLFNVSNANGLSNLLAGDLRGFAKFIRPSKIKGLDIITCGTYPPNPSELLASKKNKRLISVLSEYYDIIIFDGAPVGGLADSVILSSFMDETIIVVKDSNTRKGDLAEVKNTLDKVGARVAGVVLNMVNRKSSKYYSSYYYGSDEKHHD